MQNFSKGDLVQVADDLGPFMTHFTSGCRAIVIGSYADQFGGSDVKSYTLYLEDMGQCSWYKEHHITLIESGQSELLEKWVADKEAEDERHGDLDWIFSNPESLSSSMPGASIQALARCFGLDDLWGARGEGVDWHSNATQTLLLALPYIKSKDKMGWLDFCKSISVTPIDVHPGTINRPLKIEASTT